MKNISKLLKSSQSELIPRITLTATRLKNLEKQLEKYHFEAIKNHPLLSVIGHITEKATGCNLVTGLGQQIELTAQGWTSPKEEEN